jgi:hypothetical protein
MISHIDIAEVIIVLSDIFRILIAEVIRILDGSALAKTFILGSYAIAKAIVLDYIVIIAEVINVLSDIFRIVIAQVSFILDGFALTKTFILGSFAVAEAIIHDYIAMHCHHRQGYHRPQ